MTGIAGAASPATGAETTARARDAVSAFTEAHGRPLKLLVAKPGLDGHSNGAEQIAVRARDCGMDVVYDGIRLTPDEIVAAARDGGAHVIGLSVLSGSHRELIGQVIDGLAAAGLGHLPVVVGGIIPAADAEALLRRGVARIYTPKDYDLTAIMDEIVDLVELQAP